VTDRYVHHAADRPTDRLLDHLVGSTEISRRLRTQFYRARAVSALMAIPTTYSSHIRPEPCSLPQLTLKGYLGLGSNVGQFLKPFVAL